LDRLEATALEVARWLKARPEIELVLHPALSDCPGHEIWRRDFTGSASVFSIVFRSDWNTAQVARFAETLRLFQLGFSWGGTHSLVMAYPPLPRVPRGYDGRIVRLNVGLEEPADLIADLYRALTEEP
jgi:cystathionine beta-lyase